MPGVIDNKAPKCPSCGSSNVAEILWGMSAYDKELERKLSGCCMGLADPDWQCNDCGCEFGDRLDAFNRWEEGRGEKLRGVVYGAAIGDALGVPYEFMGRDTFECSGITGGGSHGRPAGTFSDDTSLLLATCASIKEKGAIDIEDMRQKFRSWLHEGAFTADGVVFDIGNVTSTALDQGYGCDGERSNGNGSLMRIALLAFLETSDDDVRSVSAITHAHWMSTESCVVFARILEDLVFGEFLEDAIAANAPDSKTFAFLRDLEHTPREQIRSGGFVLDTLGAALWCALHTDNFKDCVLAAVNLGDDTDTTACRRDHCWCDIRVRGHSPGVGRHTPRCQHHRGLSLHLSL